jgi:hypothetical protein
MNLTPSPLLLPLITPIDHPVIWKFIFILYNTLSVIPLPRRLEEKEKHPFFNSFEIKLKRLFLPPYVISDDTPTFYLTAVSLSLSLYIYKQYHPQPKPTLEL